VSCVSFVGAMQRTLEVRQETRLSFTRFFCKTVVWPHSSGFAGECSILLSL
jgi:hypothetical protein